MEQSATKIASVGVVDTFAKGHFTGWTYTSKDTPLSVGLYVNANLIKIIPADVLRPDVKAAGIKIERCGFDFKIDLDSLPSEGCSIELHEMVFDKPIENGRFEYALGLLTTVSKDKEPSAPQPIDVRTYVSLSSTTSANSSPQALVDMAIDVFRDMPNTTFVAMSYILVLGRTPDPDGFQGSMKANLVSEFGKREFLLNMINSDEFKNKRTISSAMNDVAKLKH